MVEVGQKPILARWPLAQSNDSRADLAESTDWQPRKRFGRGESNTITGWVCSHSGSSWRNQKPLTETPIARF